MRNFHGGEKKRISCEQAGGGRGRGRGRGRGPGKWTAASPSADFLASLRPVPNQAPGSQGSRPPPIILGPVAPPPVPMTLGDPLNPPALSFKEPTPAGCLHSACSPSLALSEQMRKGIMCAGAGAARPPTSPHPTSVGSVKVESVSTQAASAPTSNKNAAQLLRERILAGGVWVTLRHLCRPAW